MLLALAVLCAWSGLGALAFAMPKHGRAASCLIGATQIAVLRAFGWILVALALALTIASDGASFGVLMWIASLGLTGSVFIVLLSYRPRLAWWASGAFLICGLTLTRRDS